MGDLKKIFLFVKRDFSVMKGYRFSLLLNLFSVIMGIATYYFLAHLFGTKGVDILNKFGGNYFPYVIIGISLSNFLLTALNTFAGVLSSERSMGTLETIVATPTREVILFMGLSIWNFLFSSLMVILYMIIGVIVFKLDLSKANGSSFAVILLISTLVFSSLGILSASFILVFRRGNPINWLFSSVSMLVGGVYFPVDVLPSYLQFLSKLVPLTYSLEALRKAALQGQDLFELKRDFIFLSIFAVVLLPLSIISFKYALAWVKKNGSLIHY
jgi:ABC-2 type transport system permease protein